MTASSAPLSSVWRRRGFAGAATILLAIVVLAPWWRNHALLLDFCDYGLVMAATGRMAHGEHAYIDFITPIQTLQFTACAWAEHLFGPRYLSLTYANAAFTVASFLGLAALLVRRTGVGLALLIAATVVTASSGQHTILWYNAMGVTWLAVIVWLTATAPVEARHRALRLSLIWGALWLGGMTKLNYQIAALAFAVTFALRAAWLNQQTWRVTVWLILSYLAFGVIVPIATELVYTGATLHEWWYNVVQLAGRHRAGMLRQLASIRFYLHTPHDYYRSTHLLFVGAWAVLVLATTGLTAVLHIRREGGPRRVAEWGWLAILLGGAWFCGGVLLATNMDIVHLAGAAWLVLTTGVMLTVLNRNTGMVDRRVRVLLGAASVSLWVPAGWDAWAGTRALWGHEPLVREDLVAAADLPARFAYLRGLRISKALHASLDRFEAELATLKRAGVPPTALYFVNATDWMIRAVPEAAHRGLPLWLASGTTISDAEPGPVPEAIEAGRGFEVIVSMEGWDQWVRPIRETLAQHYRERVVGLLHLYERRHDLWAPIAFVDTLNWNLYSKAMRVRGGPVEALPSPAGRFLGSANPYRIDFSFGLYRLEGEMVAELRPESGVGGAEAVFRVVAHENGQPADTIWEEKVPLSPAARTVTRKFAVSPGGRRVSLFVELSAPGIVNAGWRRLSTEHAGQPDLVGAWPMDDRLPPQALTAAATGALFAPGQPAPNVIESFGSFDREAIEEAGHPACGVEGPSEIWFRLDQPVVRVSGEFGHREPPSTSPGSAPGPTFYVIYYKSGRFEILHRQEQRGGGIPSAGAPQAFDVHLPEGIGWIGLVAAPPDPANVAGVRGGWRNVRLQ